MRYSQVEKVFQEEAVGGTSTVTSDPVYIAPFSRFGVAYQATSESGTPDLRIYYELSFEKTAGFAVPDGASDINSSLTDENSHVASLNLEPATYVRFVVEGQGTNPSDTKITLSLFMQD